jgi:hypothetical protein
MPIEKRKVFWAIILFVAIIPVIRPLRLPVSVSSETRDFYNVLNEIPSGSKVVFGVTLTGPPVGLRSGYYALLSFMYSHDLKVIFIPLGVGGELACEYIATYGGIVEKYGLQYGEDYVIMPFLSGEETAMAAIATNFRQAYSMDYLNTPIDSIPLLDGINNFNDIELAIAQYGIFTFGEMFVRQWAVNYNPILIMGQFYGIAPYYGTYVTGNLDASMTKAWAEWEYIVNIPGEELIRLDAQNLQGLVTVVMLYCMIILGLTDSGRELLKKWRLDTRF